MSDFVQFRLEVAEWIAEHGTDALVAELRKAVADERRVKLGTTNVLILLSHIDKLEARVQAEEQTT
jgi:hypothetical protein